MGCPEKHQGGFTLLELLVVFTLLALLLSIAAPRYLSTLDKARETAREQNMATIRDAIDKHKADVGTYPNNLGDLVLRKYLRKVPVDPVTQSDQWIPIADPAGGTGVFDIEPPAQGVSLLPAAETAVQAEPPTNLPPQKLTP